MREIELRETIFLPFSKQWSERSWDVGSWDLGRGCSGFWYLGTSPSHTQTETYSFPWNAVWHTLSQLTNSDSHCLAGELDQTSKLLLSRLKTPTLVPIWSGRGDFPAIPKLRTTIATTAFYWKGCHCFPNNSVQKWQEEKTEGNPWTTSTGRALWVNALFQSWLPICQLKSARA